MQQCIPESSRDTNKWWLSSWFACLFKAKGNVFSKPPKWKTCSVTPFVTSLYHLASVNSLCFICWVLSQASWTFGQRQKQLGKHFNVSSCGNNCVGCVCVCVCALRSVVVESDLAGVSRWFCESKAVHTSTQVAQSMLLQVAEDALIWGFADLPFRLFLDFADSNEKSKTGLPLM